MALVKKQSNLSTTPHSGNVSAGIGDIDKAVSRRAGQTNPLALNPPLRPPIVITDDSQGSAILKHLKFVYTHLYLLIFPVKRLNFNWFDLFFYIFIETPATMRLKSHPNFVTTTTQALGRP